MVNYARGKIYKIINRINTDIYIGSTVKKYLSQRMGTHQSCIYTSNSKLYLSMRSLGFEHFKIVLIENFPCQSKDELRAREQYYIDELKPALNTNKAHLGTIGCKAGCSKEQKAEYMQKYNAKNMGKFCCEKCNYKTFTRQNLTKHKKTRKHINIENYYAQ